MGDRGLLGNRLRERLRAERERRGWSQAHTAMLLSHDAGDGIYPTTVAKIEAGDREVRVIELDAYAGLFGMTIDALMGRRGSGTDAVWAASKLTSNAQKMIGEIIGLREHFESDRTDLVEFAARDGRLKSVSQLIDGADAVLVKFHELRCALADLADQFPLPGMK